MYLWMKAFHIISMVAWFAGLFYMFRLFVYHTENKDKPEVTAVLTVMARKLYRYITTPAMVATLVFGLILFHLNPALLKLGWMHIKITLLVGLLGYHHYVGRVRKRFEAGDVYLTSKQCRIRNEYPTLFLISIVILVVVRPVF